MQDTMLRQNILDELEFEPSIDAADIGVAVEDGIVTLTGHVPTYAQKVTAENLVRHVRGVRGIAEEIEVRPAGSNMTADDEVAKRAANMIGWNTAIPANAVQVSVHKGWVTLTGEVEWQYQKEAAAKTVRALAGVTGIHNKIALTPRVSVPDVKKRIEAAFERDAKLEAHGIDIQVHDGKVTLQGHVKAWHERAAAERAAWSAPGVKSVEDKLSLG